MFNLITPGHLAIISQNVGKVTLGKCIIQIPRTFWYKLENFIQWIICWEWIALCFNVLLVTALTWKKNLLEKCNKDVAKKRWKLLKLELCCKAVLGKMELIGPISFHYSSTSHFYFLNLLFPLPITSLFGGRGNKRKRAGHVEKETREGGCRNRSV